MNKQIQQLTKSFANVDLDQIAQNIVNRLFSILLTIVIFFVILWAGKVIPNVSTCLALIAWQPFTP